MELFWAPIREQRKVPSSQTRTVKRCVRTRVHLLQTNKVSIQIHYITESIRCCGAGTAADTEFTTALISSNMELHGLSTGRKPRVVTAMTMLKQMLFRCVVLGRSCYKYSDVRSMCEKASRTDRCGTSPRRRRRYWPSPLHHSSPWLNGQIALRDHGVR